MNVLNESLNGEESLDIGSQVWNEGRLDSLDLENNQLTTIPESIGNLSSLTYLWIFNNQLTTLPESICNLNINWDLDDSKIIVNKKDMAYPTFIK